MLRVRGSISGSSSSRLQRPVRWRSQLLHRRQAVVGICCPWRGARAKDDDSLTTNNNNATMMTTHPQRRAA